MEGPRPVGPSWPDAGRALGLAGVAVATTLALRLAGAPQAAPLVVALGLFAAHAGGKAARHLGGPAVLGVVAMGTLLGPGTGEAATDLLSAWPWPHGVITRTQLARIEGLHAVCLGLVALWVGRRLSTSSRPDGALPIAAMVLGSAAVTAGAAAGLLWTLLEGPLATSPLATGVSGDAVDAGPLAELAAAMFGGSVLLNGAVLYDTRARGPVSTAIGWLAFLGEVGALVFLAGWATSGELREGVGLTLTGPGRVAATAVLGAVVGVLLGAIGRWIPAAQGVWHAVGGAVAAVATWEAGLSEPWMGLCAGLALGLVDPPADRDLLDGGTGLALTVVFTVVGATLPWRVLAPVLPLAFVVVVLRTGVLAGVASATARFAGGSPRVVRLAWTGLVASSVPVAGLLPWELAIDAATPLTALLWAVAAIDGVLGPMATNTAVHLARETPRARAEDAQQPSAFTEDARGRPVPRDLGDGALAEHVRELQQDLRIVARNVRVDAFEVLRDDGVAFLDGLRRAARRYHRKVVAAWGESPEARGPLLHAAHVELADRWRSHVLDRASRARRTRWDPADLADPLERLADQQPETLDVPHHETKPETNPPAALTRWLLGTRDKPIAYRALVTHHLGARLVDHVEPVAALYLDAEFDLVTRARALFQRVLDAHAHADPAVVDADALERSVQRDIATTVEGLASTVADASQRLDTVMHRALRGLLDDIHAVARHAQQPDAHDLRVARRQAQSARQLLGRRWTAGAEQADTRLDALALELELYALELQVTAALDEHGSHLARWIRGRGARQLDRVAAAVADALDALDTLLDQERPGQELARGVQEVARDVNRALDDAAMTADELREHLVGPEALRPLLDELVEAARQLTERYRVPVEEGQRGAWTLPAPVAVTEVDFRDVVLQYVEQSVTRDLVALTQRYALELDRVSQVIQDLDRAVHFSAELAVAELAELADAPAPAELRREARDLVRDGIGARREALHGLQGEAEGWFAVVETEVRRAVLDDLRELRMQVADGHFLDLGLARRTDSATTGPAEEATPDEAHDAVDQALRRPTRLPGPDRLRVLLGLPLPRPTLDAMDPSGFAAPRAENPVPLAYRRLFSDQALEAGELLGGREAQADRVREALDPDGPGHLRAVAVLGPDGAGQPAIVRAALRSLRTRGVHRHDLDASTSADEVRSWFESTGRGHVHVVSGLRHLLGTRPGAFEPVRALVDGVVRDGGHNGWVLVTDDDVFELATAATALERAFPAKVRIAPLSPADLRRALLARHAMSALRLRFADQPADPRARARFETRWFQDFHEASGGIARDALHLWLAAVQRVDPSAREVVLGPVPDIATGPMRHVTDDALLLLRVTLAHGQVDALAVADLFGLDPGEAAAWLVHLVHWGVLEAEDGQHRVPVHLQRALLQRLEERGWR